MADIISLSGARVLFKNTEKCLYEINKDGFITLEFIGESAEDNSSNFSSIFQALASCDIQTFFINEMEVVSTWFIQVMHFRYLQKFR